MIVAFHKTYRGSSKRKSLSRMTFEAKKTTSTVFSSNHELYNLIKSASNKEFESWEHKPSHIKAAAEKACIILNGLNKRFLHRESIELQAN